jgi:hypothetical protein
MIPLIKLEIPAFWSPEQVADIEEYSTADDRDDGYTLQSERCVGYTTLVEQGELLRNLETVHTISVGMIN